MKGIKGQLSSLSITDLMQWIDMNKKTGVLFVTADNSSKCFCFDKGRLLLAGANQGGLRFGDFIVNELRVPRDKIKDSIEVGRKEGKSFIAHMVEKKLINEDFLKVSIEQLAENSIMDILSWEEGSFQFVDELPKLCSDSPVKMSINFITFEAVRKYDELSKQKAKG